VRQLTCVPIFSVLGPIIAVVVVTMVIPVVMVMVSMADAYRDNDIR